MKKIIVPIDFSQHSEYALKSAAKLAKQYKAEILALHMLEMSDIVLTTSDGLQHQKALYFFKLAEQKFETFLKKDYLKNLKVTPIVKHFKVFSEVNDVVLKQNADLIIMGSHGASGLKEYFVGSNTERVVRNSDVPVLVVKQEITDIHFDVVAYATDFSEEGLTAYIRAKKLFDSIGSKMYLVHVNLPNDKFKSSLEIEQDVVNFLTKSDGNLDKMDSIYYVSDYSVEKGLLRSANTLGADLIAMPTHGRKGLTHFFEGSIGEDVANHATLPVMTFKM